MNSALSPQTFGPHSPDKAGVLSWIHIGDLHMRAAGQQNDLDLQAIVEEVNAVFADSISFVFLPGDNADHGDIEGYSVVREALNRLRTPWCAIVGDHDVEQNSFQHFEAFLVDRTHYAFTVGGVRFLALNAFDIPEPNSFSMLPEQLRWIDNELQAATAKAQEKVLLLHCYPSDLKQGKKELSELIATHDVKLVDMGHTHYNEISHDGKTIYTATRSTGQIEEGSVGFSVTNLDGGAVSWRFFELAQLPAVMITTPADERLMADAEKPGPVPRSFLVRAKVWAVRDVQSVEVTFRGITVPMQRVRESKVWEAVLSGGDAAPGVLPLRVVVTEAQGKTGSDEIRVLIGPDRPTRRRAERDQDNALEAWPEHGLLGTQLGPNKNGRKW